MRFLKPFVLLLALATACASQPSVPDAGGRKFAATGPQIPATYDPSVSGYAGTVGDILQVAGGGSAWVKFGTGVTDWRKFQPTPAELAESMFPVGVPRAFQTPEIDFAGTSTSTLIPARPGYVAVITTIRLVMKTGGATAGATGRIGNATISAGNDNYVASGAFPASFTFAATPSQYNLSLRSALPMVDLTNPIVVEITSGATGGALTGKIVALAWVIPAL